MNARPISVMLKPYTAAATWALSPFRMYSPRSAVGKGRNATVEQQDEVEEQQGAVDGGDALEDVVVVDPDDADDDEAHDVRGVRGPLVREVTSEVARLRVGDAHLDDEQRDGDREDAVAERFESRLFGILES